MRKKLFALLIGILAVTLLLTACAGVNLTLTFEVDGEAYATVTTTGQEAVQMPKNPVKEGFVFDGWYWDKDVWEKPFTANSLLETPLSDNMTVYAKFVEKSEVEQFTVIFNANGGAFDAQTTSLSQTVAKNSTLTAPTSPARSGYSFSGWATDSTGSVMWQFGSDRVLGNLTLYAIWNQQSAAVLSIDGAQIKGMEIHMFVSPETESVSLSNKVICSTDSIWRLYYDRLGQTEIPTKIAVSKQGELLDGDNVFYLVVTSMSGSQVNTYTLTIHRSYLATVSYYDGVSLLKTVSFYTGNSFKASFIPKITGYVFNGWAKKDETSFDEDVLWKSTELYTVKTPNSYTVHYNVREGEMSESTAKVNYGESYRLAVPTRIGYTFVGWKYGSQRLTDGKGSSLAAFKQTSDITVTDEWTANDYNLTLKQNIKSGTISGEGKFKYDSRVYVTAKAEEGYAFVGWYDNKDVLLSKNAAYDFIMGLDLVLTAKFELAKLTLNYVVNGKVADTETFTLDKPITEFLKYSTQSNFVGWFSSAKFNVTDTKITTTEELTLTNNNAYLYGGTYTGAEGQEFIYTNNGYTLSAFRGTATGVEISSSFNGVSVKSIGERAFYNCSSLVSVEIPSSVTSIGSSAFRGCSSLESITIPYVGATKDGTSNTHFGYIFGANSNSYNSSYVPKALKTVIVTGGTSIGTYAFSNCYSLESVVIPTSVTSIGSDAFYNCNSLVSITIPYVGATKDGTSNTHFGYIFGANSNSYNSNYVPKTLKTVIITGGTSIGYSAFRDCSSLVSVEIPSSVTSIGDGAFGRCGSLINVVIPNSVTSIGSEAFYNCSSLVSVEIPSSVTSIDDRAFSGCSSLVSVEIPNSVTSIYSYAFSGCISLVSVEIPSSVTGIGSDAFLGCSSLETITVAEGNTTYHSAGNCLIETETKTLILGCKNSIIPTDGSVTSIGAWAFHGCSSLASIEIPSGVTSIGSYAFYNCSSLVSVAIPNSVTSIDTDAFYNCSSLVSVAIPSSVTSIGRNAFNGCSSLESVEIPNSVTSIGSAAFFSCYSLTIYAEASAKPSGWDSYWNYSNCPVVWDYKNNDVADDGVIYTVQNGIRYGIKDGVATVVRQPRNNITTTNIPSEIVYKDKTYSVTSIGSQAFGGCSSLASIEIPSSVTSIGSEAFGGCSSLASIEIPSGVTYIGSDAFSSCYSLTIYAEASAKPSGWDSEWNSYRPVVWDYKNNDVADDGFIYTVQNGIRYGIKDGVATVVRQPINITTANIPSEIVHKNKAYKVTSIGSSAFSNCRSLVSVEIPDSVTSIGSDAFYNCISLVSVEIPSSVTSIGTEAFSGTGIWNNTAENSVVYADKWAIGYKGEKGTVTNIVLRADTVGIGSWAFRGCSSLVSIEIPSSVKSIGFSAFDGCSSLVSVVIPTSVTSIGSYAFYGCDSLTKVEISDIAAWCGIKFENSYANPLYYAKHLYLNGEEVTELVIPEDVTSIGTWAFYNCRSLVSVEIPRSVTSIGDFAFRGCSSLESIEIPKSVTSIGASAFYWCSSLVSIEIPKSVTSIGASAFYWCSSLVSIVYDGTKAEWEAIAKGSYWNNSTGNYTVTCTNETLSKAESML